MIGYYNYTVILTYMGLISGLLGIFASIEGHPIFALGTLMFAGFCDMFDGLVARTKKDRTDKEKKFGIQLDSLADFVCYGILPVVIVYTTGVKELDDILKDSYHYLMYQESIMKYLIWLGIKESESYDIIKKIAKKKFKEKELTELKTQLKEGWLKQVGKEEGFDDTWQVVEDASKYSFNASHSLSYAYDSLYGAYLKANYPLEYYAVTLNLYNDDMDRTIKLTNELPYFNINIKNPKFRYSKAEYFPDRKTHTIYKGI